MYWLRILFGIKQEIKGQVLTYDEMMILIESKRKFRFF